MDKRFFIIKNGWDYESNQYYVLSHYNTPQEAINNLEKHIEDLVTKDNHYDNYSFEIVEGFEDGEKYYLLHDSKTGNYISYQDIKVVVNIGELFNAKLNATNGEDIIEIKNVIEKYDSVKKVYLEIMETVRKDIGKIKC